ncbi:MAG: YIP1 family protein [Euryarchaeota archaeon]|nr:YIP1 family protein [Euryarchaeota archaeon]
MECTLGLSLRTQKRWQVLREIILSPSKAFEKLAETESLDFPFLIVFTLWVSFILGMFIFAVKLAYSGLPFRAPPITIIANEMLFSAPGVIVTALIFWLGVAALLHVLSRLFQGQKKKFTNLLALIGYSHTPMFFSVIAFIATTALIKIKFIEGATESQFFMDLSRNYIPVTIIFIISFLWMVCLWVISVQKIYKFSAARAVMIVSVPASILLFLIGLSNYYFFKLVL